MDNVKRDETQQIESRRTGRLEQEFVADLIVPSVKFSAIRGQNMPSSEKIRFRAETYEAIYDTVCSWFKHQNVNVETELFNELLTMFWSVPDDDKPILLGIIVKKPILSTADTPVVYEAKAVFDVTCGSCGKLLLKGQMVYEKLGKLHHWDCRQSTVETT